jgi:hypothetical protein
MLNLESFGHIESHPFLRSVEMCPNLFPLSSAMAGLKIFKRDIYGEIKGRENNNKSREVMVFIENMAFNSNLAAAWPG